MEILAGAEAHVRVGILLGAADFVGSRDVMLLRHRAKGETRKTMEKPSGENLHSSQETSSNRLVSLGGGGLGLARVFGGWLEPARAGSGRLRKDEKGDATSNTCCW